MDCLPRIVSRVAPFCAIVLAVSAAGAADASQLRQCQPPAVDVNKLYGRNPREVRAILSPLLGPPAAETNQLPDGGTFARLDIADQQDGVSQRYFWGGTEGSLEVVYQRGRAHLASIRLEEFETVVRSRTVMPCKPWPRDALALRVGLRLPKKATTARQSRGQTSYRYDLHTSVKQQSSWVVRVRCGSNETKCVDIGVYFPLHVPPGDESLASMQITAQPAIAAQPVIVPEPSRTEARAFDATPAPVPGERRPLKTN